jgi:transposase-like protein
MALIELIEKDADTDLVRAMLSFAAERLMEAEMEARTGAGHGLRDLARLVQRNGYRERAWDTRARSTLRSPGTAAMEATTQSTPGRPSASCWAHCPTGP